MATNLIGFGMLAALGAGLATGIGALPVLGALCLDQADRLIPHLHGITGPEGSAPSCDGAGPARWESCSARGM